MEDLHAVGGVPAVMKMLLEKGLIDGSQNDRHRQDDRREPDATCRGLTRQARRSSTRSTTRSRRTATSASCAATSRPTGASRKITGKEGTRFGGTAKVLRLAKKTCSHGLEQKQIGKGDVIVIRYEGPKGGPGMPEMLTPTARSRAAGLLNDVALITDGRFSGGSHGFIIGHVTPEAIEGGPIALAQDRRPRSRIDADNEHDRPGRVAKPNWPSAAPRGRSRRTRRRAARSTSTSRT